MGFQRNLTSLLALALLWSTTGCQPPAAVHAPADTERPAAEGDQPDVVAVTARDMTKSLDVPASFEGNQQASLKPRIEGYVGRVLVDIGDEVTQEQLLAELSVPELANDVERRVQMVEKAKAEVKSRDAEVEQARSKSGVQKALKSLRELELKRVKSLAEGGAYKKEKIDEAQYAVDAVTAALAQCEADIKTAEAHVDSAKADLGVAEAELAKARTMLNYTKITAPFSGVITTRNVDPGSFVRPASGQGSMPMFEIIDARDIRVVIFIPIKDASLLDIGDKVTLHSIQGMPGESIVADIDRHARSFHQGSRMLRAEIDLKNPKGLYKPGDYGKVKLTLEEYKDIPSMPKSAVHEENDQSYVIQVNKDGKMWRRNVQILAYEGKAVGVRGSFDVGIEVIKKNTAKYKDTPLHPDEE